MICDCCGKEIEKPDHIGTGYGTLTNPDGSEEIHCYACCSVWEEGEMRSTGRATLYDCEKEVADWPGGLRFKVISRSTGDHNWGLKRYDVWFRGPDKRVWHGVRYGDMTQLVHCKRTKEAAS